LLVQCSVPANRWVVSFMDGSFFEGGPSLPFRMPGG